MNEPAIVVELLDRAGAVVARHRSESLPVRLGRAYDNDVIVDDPFVAPCHVRIERRDDGVLVARDAGTQNGIHAARRRRRWKWGHSDEQSREIALSPDTVVRAGHSSFRVRTSDQAVAPERLDTTAHAWEGLRPSTVALVMVVLLALLNAWTLDTSTQETFIYESNLAIVTGMMVGWAGAWALLNRLFAGRARFGRHFLIGALGLAAAMLMAQLGELVAYSFSLGWPIRYESYISLAVLAVAVYFHVATITPLSPWVARRSAVVFAVLAMGLFGLYRYAEDHQLGDGRYMGALSWPAVRMANPIGSDKFVKSLEDARLRADRARSENGGSDDE